MPDLTISGGATGIDARTDDMRALADVLDGRGDVLRDIAGRIGRIAIDETVLSSQLLSPLTGADVLAKVVVAELPPHGVLWVALEFEARAVFLRGAAFLYDETDAALALLAELQARLVGVVIINVAVSRARCRPPAPHRWAAVRDPDRRSAQLHRGRCPGSAVRPPVAHGVGRRGPAGLPQPSHAACRPRRAAARDTDEL